MHDRFASEKSHDRRRDSVERGAGHQSDENLLAFRARGHSVTGEAHRE